MSKLPIVNAKQLEKLLLQTGFVIQRQKGSHKFYEVKLENADLTIRYGRIGDNGQTQKKTLETHRFDFDKPSILRQQFVIVYKMNCLFKWLLNHLSRKQLRLCYTVFGEIFTKNKFE